MSQKLRDFPHLPLLDFDKCMAVFKLANIGPNRLAALSGFSRQSVYFWRKNKRNLDSLSLDKVNTLAWKALKLLREKRLPLVGRPSIEWVQATFDSIDLSAVTHDVLPAKWREELTQ